MEVSVLYLSHTYYVGPSRVDCMLNERVCMHPCQVVLAYCDESLSYIWKSRGLM